MIRVEPDIVLARPHHFHRLSGFLGQHRRFHGKIRKRFPPKRAAQQRDVNGHILFLCAHCLRNRIPRALRILRWNPRFHFPIAINRQRRRRFHRSVRQQRRIIFRLNHLSVLCERFVYVPDFPDNFPWLPRRLFQLFAIRSRIKNFVRALVPFHLQLLSPLHSRPRAVRQHGDSAQRLHIDRRLVSRNRLGFFHAAHRQRLFVIHRLHRAAHHRRMHPRRVQHPFPPPVLTQNSFPRAPTLQSVTVPRFPGATPFAARLQLHFFFLRHVLLPRRRGQFPISQLLPGFLVHHRMQFCRAFRSRHVPLLRRRPHQH